MDDLVDIAKAFAIRKLPAGNRTGVLTLSGGAGVLLADRCVESGLMLPEFAPGTTAQLKETLVSFASCANPVDATANGYNDNFASYGKAVRIVLARGFTVPERFNRQVITDEASLRAELGATRQRGYGLAVEEGEKGTAAIAFPIFEALATAKPAVGTVSVAGPVVRLTPPRIAEMAEETKAAALEMSIIWPMRRFRRLGEAPGDLPLAR